MRSLILLTFLGLAPLSCTDGKIATDDTGEADADTDSDADADADADSDADSDVTLARLRQPSTGFRRLIS